MGSFPNITILVQNGFQLPHPLGEDIKAPLRAKTPDSLSTLLRSQLLGFLHESFKHQIGHNTLPWISQIGIRIHPIYIYIYIYIYKKEEQIQLPGFFHESFKHKLSHNTLRWIAQIGIRIHPMAI
jgi:hypothetical protein